MTISFRSDVDIEFLNVSSINVRVGGLQYTYRNASSGLVAAIQSLANGLMTRAEIEDRVLTVDGAADLAAVIYYLDAFVVLGLLAETFWSAAGKVVTIQYAGRAPRPPVEERRPGRLQLSRFALIRRIGENIVVESPCCHAMLIIHDLRLVLGFTRMARPMLASDTLMEFEFLGAAASALIDLAVREGLLIATADDGESEELPEPGDTWEFHDLLFHARSRDGRHLNRYGATYPGIHSGPAPPVARKNNSVERIYLAMHEADDSASGLAGVLRRRRSVRTYSRDGLAIQELGRFLNLAARVQCLHGTGDPVSLRPSPSAGARHPLEIYVVANRVRELPPAIYHYDAIEHVLRKVAESGGQMTTILHDARRHADRPAGWEPHTVLVFTARFRRVSWKYESVAYANILKDVGALMQTMYLVATALELTPCALGGGDSDLFGELIKLDYYEESVVGEFLLGGGNTM